MRCQSGCLHLILGTVADEIPEGDSCAKRKAQDYFLYFALPPPKRFKVYSLTVSVLEFVTVRVSVFRANSSSGLPQPNGQSLAESSILVGAGREREQGKGGGAGVTKGEGG